MSRALDHPGDEHERMLLRLGLPVGKYWICKRAPQHAYEAMECLGGNGVIEDFITARIYRDAPINAIWEGSGNVQALDALRAISRSPEVLDAWFAEIDAARGNNPALDDAVAATKAGLVDATEAEYRARELVDALALTMQGRAARAGRQCGGRRCVPSRRGCARNAHLRDLAARSGRRRDHRSRQSWGRQHHFHPFVAMARQLDPGSRWFSRRPTRSR
jgi:putative acyl-CoA dehydrogenase